MASSPSSTADITYLTQDQAIAVDEDLMGPALGFSVDSLMELAGLSVACALVAEYPAATHPRVLVLAGPGNNGGDGLVAGRHLTHFGYSVAVCYPKPTDRPLYKGLVKQLASLGVPFVSHAELRGDADGGSLRGAYDVVVDALFGFSFRGAPRPPFDDLLRLVAPPARPPPVVAVDIPSGWHVENGPQQQAQAQAAAGAAAAAAAAGDAAPPPLQPDMLVSLTAPKLAARFFRGPHHYLGGRFVPPAVREKYALRLPPYPGTAQCVKLPPAGGGGAAAAAAAAAGEAAAGAAASAATAATAAAAGAASAASAAAAAATAAAAAAELAAKRVADMRVSYERDGLVESDAPADPLQLFDRWFKEATAARASEEPNAMALATVDAATLQPSARFVLLKGYDARGFSFYTNYESRKGLELASSGRAALVFWWEALQRSVRVEGRVERLPEAEADAYFASRPHGSRVGAWVSHQSRVVPGGRAEIEARQRELAARYEDEAVPVPRPPHWGGFLVRPERVEFWCGRPSRLHDRLSYTRKAEAEAEGAGEGGGGAAWTMERLWP